MRLGETSHRIARYRVDVVVLSGLCAVLIATCVLASRRKFLWHDELVSRAFITDPSPAHMVAVMRDGGEVAPPLYHLLARVWVSLWGASPLSLRLFTTVSFCAAAAILWTALRKAYTVRAAAFGVVAVFTSSMTLFWQIAEIRFYGLLMLAAAWAVLSSLIVMTQPATSRRLVVANAASHTTLVWTHYFGLVYSVALLVAVLVNDVRGRRLRPAVYASIGVAWLSFVPWLLPAARQSRMVGQSWIAEPSIAQLMGSYQFDMPWLAVIVLAAIALPALESIFGVPARASAVSDAASLSRAPLLLVAASLLCVPLVVFVESHLWQPLFLDRYMLPSLMAWAILLAHMVDTTASYSARTSPPGHRGLRHRAARVAALAAWVGFVVLLLAQPIFYAGTGGALRPGGYGGGFDDNPWRELERATQDRESLREIPVALEFGLHYLPMSYYSEQAGRSVAYILDRESATAASTKIPGAYMWYVGLATNRRVGYGARGIVTSDEFLCARDRFLVLDDPRIPWYERVGRDPVFRSRIVGIFRGRDTLRYVERTALPRGLACPPRRGP